MKRAEETGRGGGEIEVRDDGTEPEPRGRRWSAGREGGGCGREQPDLLARELSAVLKSVRVAGLGAA